MVEVAYVADHMGFRVVDDDPQTTQPVHHIPRLVDDPQTSQHIPILTDDPQTTQPTQHIPTLVDVPQPTQSIHQIPRTRTSWAGTEEGEDTEEDSGMEEEETEEEEDEEEEAEEIEKEAEVGRAGELEEEEAEMEEEGEEEITTTTRPIEVTTEPVTDVYETETEATTDNSELSPSSEYEEATVAEANIAKSLIKVPRLDQELTEVDLMEKEESRSQVATLSPDTVEVTTLPAEPQTEAETPTIVPVKVEVLPTMSVAATPRVFQVEPESQTAYQPEAAALTVVDQAAVLPEDTFAVESKAIPVVIDTPVTAPETHSVVMSVSAEPDPQTSTSTVTVVPLSVTSIESLTPDSSNLLSLVSPSTQVEKVMEALPDVILGAPVSEDYVTIEEPAAFFLPMKTTESSPITAEIVDMRTEQIIEPKLYNKMGQPMPAITNVEVVPAMPQVILDEIPESMQLVEIPEVRAEELVAVSPSDDQVIESGAILVHDDVLPIALPLQQEPLDTSVDPSAVFIVQSPGLTETLGKTEILSVSEPVIERISDPLDVTNSPSHTLLIEIEPVQNDASKSNSENYQSDERLSEKPVVITTPLEPGNIPQQYLEISANRKRNIVKHFPKPSVYLTLPEKTTFYQTVVIDDDSVDSVNLFSIDASVSDDVVHSSAHQQQAIIQAAFEKGDETRILTKAKVTPVPLLQVEASGTKSLNFVPVKPEVMLVPIRELPVASKPSTSSPTSTTVTKMSMSKIPESDVVLVPLTQEPSASLTPRKNLRRKLAPPLLLPPLMNPSVLLSA